MVVVMGLVLLLLVLFLVLLQVYKNHIITEPSQSLVCWFFISKPLVIIVAFLFVITKTTVMTIGVMMIMVINNKQRQQ